MSTPDNVGDDDAPATDPPMTDTNDTIPDLFEDWHAEHGDDPDMIQARAFCRMVAIQQAQLELHTQQREQRQEMLDDMMEDLSHLTGNDDSSAADDFRFDPDDDDPYF